MSEKSSIRQAIFGVSGIVILSKLLGFLREMVIAERFGTSAEYDIFLIAIAAPIFFNLVIVRSANFLTVPLLSKKLDGNNSFKDRKEIWSLANSLLGVVLLVILLLIIAAPYLVKLIGSELEGEKLKTGILYCRLFSVVLLFGFLESFFRSALNVKKHFVYPVMGTVILNIFVITIIYLYSAQLSVASILVGLLVGSFIQILFLLLKLFNVEFIKYFNLRIFRSEIRKTLAVGGTIMAVELLVSTFFLIDRYFASDMTEGVVSALNYCSLLVMLPVSIIAFAVASVTFPYLSERTDESQKKNYSSLLNSSLVMSLSVGIPCGIFYLMFARDITAAVFLRGAFDMTSLTLTSDILVYLTPYLVCLFIYTILIQACYSTGYQRYVFLVAVLSTALKFLLTWLLKSYFDYQGIAMATSLVQCFTIAVLLFVLIRKKRLENLSGLFMTTGKIILASVPIILIGFYYQNFPDFSANMDIFSKLRIVPAAIISFIGFVAISYLVNIGVVKETISGLVQRNRE